MYRPNHFQPSTDEQWIQLIKDNPLATVISNGAKNLEISPARIVQFAEIEKTLKEKISMLPRSQYLKLKFWIMELS